MNANVPIAAYVAIHTALVLVLVKAAINLQVRNFVAIFRVKVINYNITRNLHLYSSNFSPKNQRNKRIIIYNKAFL